MTVETTNKIFNKCISVNLFAKMLFSSSLIRKTRDKMAFDSRKQSSNIKVQKNQFSKNVFRRKGMPIFPMQ